jgi:hypothetical protein
MLESLLDQLARQRGIGDAYHNYRGDLLQIGRHTKTAILAAMGCPTTDAAAIEHELHADAVRHMRQLLPPVVVLHPQRTGVAVAIPADELEQPVRWQITLASGDKVGGEVLASSLQEHERCELDGRWQTRRDLLLPGNLPHGYHALHVSLGSGATAHSALVVAPQQCFEPRVLRDGQRLWGVAVQLYTLRSAQNWGIGDFADLATVVRGCAGHGAAFIGLNPLHALFPGNPWQFSPYSASSRHFLNVMYIAVEQVPEYARCDVARAHVTAATFQAELARLRGTAVVDYPGVARAKLPVLRLLHAQFRRERAAGASVRGAQFAAYLAERGESLHLHALHDALD